jgi:hypothetical protein
MARIVLAALFSLILGQASAFAETIGYAEAIDRLAASCGKDIAKHCKNVNLGGGRMSQCLDRNATVVSAQCKAANTQVRALLAKRIQARALVPRVCDVDIRRLCAGVQAGDGNLMECFYKAKKNISPQCQQAVSDAGYE